MSPSADGSGDHVSPQWAQWRAEVDLHEYEARFTHDQAHGEADCIADFGAASVLDAGCGTGRVAIELHRRGIETVGVDFDHDLLALARTKQPAMTWVQADLATLDLGRRFGLVAMPGNVMLFCRTSDRESVVRSCAAHVRPGGWLVTGFALREGATELGLDEYDRCATAAGLRFEARWASWDRAPYGGGDYAVSVHRHR